MEQDGSTRIVIAVNQSSLKGYPHPSISSKNAFEWALKKLIRSTRHQDFKLYILHVQVPDRDASNNVNCIFACPDDFKQLKSRGKIKGIRLLEYFVRWCSEIGLACEAWIKIGDAKEVICNEVKRLRPDILVVGSRGLNRLETVFAGSVSEFCSKHADCPVIVVKRKPEDTPQNPVND